MSSRRRRGGNRQAPYAQMGTPPGQRQPTREELMNQQQQLMPLIRGRELSLGDLSGDVVEPVIATFTYFGEQVRVNPNLTETMVIDLLEAADEIEVNDPSQLVATKDYVRDHIHPEDFDRFWQTAVDNRQGVQDTIKVCWRILEQITDRPTTPPSDSSDGRLDTATNSQAGASAPAIGSPGTAPTFDPTDVKQVADHFVGKFEAEGRPDKAAQIMVAAEARERRALATV